MRQLPARCCDRYIKPYGAALATRRSGLLHHEIRALDTERAREECAEHAKLASQLVVNQYRVMHVAVAPHRVHSNRIAGALGLIRASTIATIVRLRCRCPTFLESARHT